MPRFLNKEISFLVFFFFWAAFFFAFSYFFIAPKTIGIIFPPAQISESSLISPSLIKESREKTIGLILVGDIMLDRGVEYMIDKYGEGDFRFPFLKIANELKGAKLLFGNLEGPISDKGTKVGSIYSFRNDPKAIEGLNYAGFDVLSVANNHVFDYGKEALEDTFLRLKEAGIDYVGGGFNEKEAYSPIIKEIKSAEIGFLAYTNLGSPFWAAAENSSGIAWVDEKNLEKVKADIKLAKEKVDILIVSLHSGEEYAAEPTQFQTEFAKAAIDAGADLVVGHHSHVIQKSEKYPSTDSASSPQASSGQAGWIFYSLGNFIFDQSFSEETMQGLMIKVLIENPEGKQASYGAGKKIKEIKQREIKINDYFQPFLNP